MRMKKLRDMEPCFLILTPDNIRNKLSTFKSSREKDLAQDFANIVITLCQYILPRGHEPVPEEDKALTRRCNT